MAADCIYKLWQGREDKENYIASYRRILKELSFFPRRQYLISFSDSQSLPSVHLRSHSAIWFNYDI
jgi:hypothetical protein